MYALNKKRSIAERKRDGEKSPFKLIAQEKKAMAQNAATSQQGQITFGQLFAREQDAVFDLFCQILGDQKVAGEQLELLAKKARKQYKKEKFQKYSSQWLMRRAVMSLEEHFRQLKREEQMPENLPLAHLDLDERLSICLHERLNIKKRDIAIILQHTVGGVEMRLMRAREKLARVLMEWSGQNPFALALKHNSLATRIAINKTMDGEQCAEITGEDAALYKKGLDTATAHIRDLTAFESPDLELDTKTKISMPGLRLGWGPIPWHYKLAVESFVFAIVGALAVILLPTIMAHYYGNEESIQKANALIPSVVNEPKEVDRESERYLASLEQERIRNLEEFDEFKDVAFPAGERFKRGSAPLAPSRKKAAIYRLILPSAQPEAMIPEIRTLFRDQHAREKSISGTPMPGGVYFDVETTEGSYRKILSSIQKLGATKTYFNQRGKRRPYDRARVIIWIQQI